MPHAASTDNFKVLWFPGVFTDKWSGSRDQGFKIRAIQWECFLVLQRWKKVLFQVMVVAEVGPLWNV